MTLLVSNCSNCVNSEEHDNAIGFLFCKVQETRVGPEDWCADFSPKYQVQEVNQEPKEPPSPGFLQQEPVEWGLGIEPNETDESNETDE